MDTPIQKDLDSIVREINNLLPEAKVYLFGSYASGTQQEDSDLDLCVVVPRLHDRRMEIVYNIRCAIDDLTKLPMDILLYTTDEFERNSRLRPTLQYTISQKGVLLNGR